MFVIDFFKFSLAEKKKMDMKALEGFHIRYTIDNCKNKVEIQEVLDSLTNLSLVKAYHAMIDPDHFCYYCFRCRLHNWIQDTLIARDSPEFRLGYSSEFLTLKDLEPYPFYEIYLENIRKKYLWLIFLFAVEKMCEEINVCHKFMKW